MFLNAINAADSLGVTGDLVGNPSCWRRRCWLAFAADLAIIQNSASIAAPNAQYGQLSTFTSHSRTTLQATCQFAEQETPTHSGSRSFAVDSSHPGLRRISAQGRWAFSLALLTSLTSLNAPASASRLHAPKCARGGIQPVPWRVHWCGKTRQATHVARTRGQLSKRERQFTKFPERFTTDDPGRISVGESPW